MATKQDENALATAIAASRRTLLHWRGRATVAQALDTMDALGYETRHGQRPLLSHYHRTSSGWHLAWALPAGISSQDIVAKLSHFEEQCEASIACETRGRILHMEIRTQPLPERIPYEWCVPSDMALPVPIGHTPAGLLPVDLARLPHMFVAGNTGGGKTTYLRGLAVAGILAGARVVIVDLKGLDFAHLAKSGHAVVADTEASALAALAALNRELDRRKGILKAAGATRLQDHGGLPWIIAIIDELAELQDRQAQDQLNRLARLARAAGISLVCATQRPSHTLFQRFTDTRMLFSGRLMFACPKPEDSRLILDSDRAARLPPVPGRAIWKWDLEVEVQCMDIGPREAQRLLAGIPVKEVTDLESGPNRLPAR